MSSKKSPTKSRRMAAPLCPDARATRMPAEIRPMLATLVDEPFSDPKWIFETKWDGFRSICFIRNGNSRFVSRNQIEMTPQYPELTKVGQQIAAREAILDGEIVALDKDGMPRFQLLQNKLRIRSGSYAPAKNASIVYFVFDLLYVDGHDMRNCSVVERKAALAKILRPAGFVKVSEHVEGEGEAFFREIEKFHLEGMIAKRAGSLYLPRRSTDWLKVKTIMRAEVVVAGYTQPRGARSYFGSLVCGLYRGDELHYVAHIGGGFNEKLLASIHKLMQPLRIETSVFVKPPKTNEPVQWIRPKLVAEVKFSEWTADNRLRQPIFVGLREDKNAKDCRFEFEGDTDEVVERAGKNKLSR